MADVTDLAIEELKNRVKVSSQKAVAEQLDITPQYLSDIMNGRRDLSDNIRFKLGFVKVSVLVKPTDVEHVVKSITVALGERKGVDRVWKEVQRKVKEVAVKR